jgi:broad specificity phosphatase PhoE
MTGPVLWMRHGTCNDGLGRPAAHARPDSSLTLLGGVECRRTALRLDKDERRPSLILSSPLPRAQQSAAIVAAVLGLPSAEVEPLVTEWRAPDCVLGLARDEYPTEYQHWREHRAHDIDSALPGGESLRSFAIRAAEAMRVTASRADGRFILVVSHRLLIAAVAALVQGHRDPAVIFASAS